jgi:hypothetical protein
LIEILVHSNPDRLIVVISAQGLLVDLEAQLILKNKGVFLYTDLLRYSKLGHFFALQKLVLKLNADLQIDFLRADCQQISIDIPKLRPAGF